jgi:predicted ATP-grasp superfamily ATP-dependent carboligase
VTGERTARAGARRGAGPPIVVLGFDRVSMHHGALAIVRFGGRRGIPVFAAHGGGLTPVERSRYCAGHVELPVDVNDDGRLERLRAFGSERGRSVLIPVDDASAMFVNDHAEQLAEAFLFPRQPEGLTRALASKREMQALCLEHGVPTPGGAFPESEDDVRAHAEAARFPVVAKRIDNSLSGDPRAPNVAIASDREELLASYRLMESSQAPNVLLQEYIPGTPESIWMLNGYFDASSECLLAFTGQKIRQAPPYTGATTLGVCRANAVVEETTRRFMKALGYRGILDIGYRYDARDGEYKLLDVNPRIGSSFRLFAGADGTDVLHALYADLTGGVVPPTAAVEGRRWIVEPLDLRSSMSYIRRGDLTVLGWLRSLRGIDETAWWARDDPRPLLVQLDSLVLSRALRPAMSRQ